MDFVAFFQFTALKLRKKVLVPEIGRNDKSDRNQIFELKFLVLSGWGLLPTGFLGLNHSDTKMKALKFLGS